MKINLTIHQRGVTLLEMLAGLVILSIILSFVIPMTRELISGAEDGVYVQTKSCEYNKIRNKYRTQNNYVGFTTQRAAQQDLTCSQANGNLIVNMFNGNSTYAAAQVNVANDAFQVTDTNIPETSCEAIDKLEGNLVTASVNGTDVFDVGQVDFTQTALQDECIDRNTIVLVYQ